MSRVAAVFIRIPIVALTLVFGLVGIQYLIAPVQTAAGAGIILTSPGAATVARIGFGAFPFAFAALFVVCLVSPGRILLGLQAELILLTIVMATRIFGMTAGYSTETGKLLLPEAVMAALCVLAIRLELKRRKRSSSTSTNP